MADEMTVKDEGGYVPPPEGQFLGVCVDVVNLGRTIEQYLSNPARIVPKVALVFQIAELDDDGRPYEISVEKTVGFGPKAGLRDFLGKWRGKGYTDEEARSGSPLHKLVGVNALLTIEHKTSGAGRLYAKVSNISPPLKGMPKLPVRDYTRSEYWAKKKEEYAAKVGSQNAITAAVDGDSRPFAAIAADVDAEGSDLPF
jgi:hypothetical protein